MTTYQRIAQLALGATLSIQVGCNRGPSVTTLHQAVTESQVANLHAFARLYGVVRWFHPSDAAAANDWDHFVIDGVHRVVDAPDGRALRMRLLELFAPIAPTMRIVGPGEVLPGEPAPHPKSAAGLDVIAWQHKGYGDSTVATGYASKRLHRARIVPQPGALFAALSQSFDATSLRGARVRLRGKLRTANHARGQLWLRVDRGDALGFFDNMAQRPVVSATWAQAEIIGTIDADATRIVFGELNPGRGTVWYDDLELSVNAADGTWKPIEIHDGGFEGSDPLTSWHLGVGRSAPPQSIDGWSVTIDHGSPASGAGSLRLEPITKVVTEELFVPAPVSDETVDIDLGSELHARVPLALFSERGHTIGDDPEDARRAQDASRHVRPAGFDVLAGAADVIVFWNVFEHFWPYWNTVSVDWSAMLDDALAAALAERNVDDRVATLERLSAGAPDGHIFMSCPGETQHGYLPFVVDLVESQIVVTTSADPAIERGDVVVSIDGQPATQLLDMEQAFISGSPQWRVVRALPRLGGGPLGSILPLRLLRDGNQRSVSVARVRRNVADQPGHPPIARLDDGTYYVDLSRATMTDIDAVMDPLAAAPGVVFDLRGYPKQNEDVLSHIVTQLDDLKGWELIPLIIRPDSPSAPAAWEDTSTWNMPLLSVLQPHIRGRIAFLTGPGAISMAESFMALVEHYRLGAIVGSPTAGTNGDIAEITLPTGCSTRFTGRRVTKPDGGPHHLVGVQPTIPATRTVAGVRAGRDEVLERALVYVRGSSR